MVPTRRQKRNRLHQAAGFIRYYLAPRREVVCILSTVRSGSTLLKALLAMAPDVSHLPEVPFRTIPRNRYQAYRHISHLSRRRIVVLKRPGSFTDTRYPQLPNLDPRVIVLTRDVPGVVASWQRLRPDAETAFLATRWAEIYQRILDRTQVLPARRVARVRYEDILADPVAETARLFGFIGSVRRHGTDEYAPGDFAWRYGSDDGSPRIHTRRVQRDAPPGAPSAIDAEMARALEIPAVEAMRAHLGYGAPAPADLAVTRATSDPALPVGTVTAYRRGPG